jgi:hypothetical protein
MLPFSASVAWLPAYQRKCRGQGIICGARLVVWRTRVGQPELMNSSLSTTGPSPAPLPLPAEPPPLDSDIPANWV